MNIPLNLTKIKEAFSVDQVNQMISEGWKLVAITQRAGANGPAYTMGRLSAEAPDLRLSAANRARGISA